ncbi:UNVERIFIED_CONTAM: hypothetical protein K2H54_023620 [Gekko kuhli]
MLATVEVGAIDHVEQGIGLARSMLNQRIVQLRAQGPVAIFGAFGGFVFIVVVCIICYNIHKKSRERRPEITRTQPIPPPAFVPPGPTAPPLILASDPPPYSEVIGKSDFFPAPVGQPPCYDNIAMEDLSSMEGARPPGSRLTD